MKRIVSLLLCLAFSFALFSQNNLDFITANEAYNKAEYSKAINLYEKIIKSGEHSANLYFNLANSYYKLNKIAPSIYNYEKALILEPNNKAVQINYGYAKQNKLDAIEVLSKGFLTRMYGKLTQRSVDFWAWLAVVGVFVFVVGFIFFYRSVYASQRKIYFGFWSIGILLALFSLVFAYATSNKQQNIHYAIIFTPEVELRSEPNVRGETVFKIHEGTKVQVLESIDNWKEVLLANGTSGWIQKDSIKEL